MRFTWKDIAATGSAGAVVVVYAAYLAFDGISLTTMAIVGLVLGFASRRIGGRGDFAHEHLAFVGGLGSMGLGIATLITESEALLAVFVASIVGLWLAAMYAHFHVAARHGAPTAH